ncbi:ECF transporter S component [Natranaerobius thermophilus]|uniref:ECF transporter S component n=1 Tax=Natranaerobius thermophilus (strain ATCC BAA-1301 / DSM 18059 / JW/NM-WN-LF) TaxID=457570 RepID=B2A0G2_NATTJ|nr:ECF transporter S component [Natranaerobius thermophilus]ACB84523.1 conserved hypothetical protein [Natranaerobius thermophilus JW/NM-WN-LF]
MLSLDHRELVKIALLIALSMIGSQIKIPSLTGTPALDSFPAYLAAFIWVGKYAAAIGFFGHIFTSLLVGFPMSIPIHLILAVGMAGCVYAVSHVNNYSGRAAGVLAGMVLNGLILPGIFVLIPGFGIPFFMGMVVPVTVASAVNIGLAVTAAPVCSQFLNRKPV